MEATAGNQSSEYKLVIVGMALIAVMAGLGMWKGTDTADIVKLCDPIVYIVVGYAGSRGLAKMGAAKITAMNQPKIPEGGTS